MSDPTATGSGTAAPPAPRRLRLAPFVALAVVAVLIGFVVVLAAADPPGDDAETANTPLLGEPAPEVVTTTIDGAPFDLTRRRGSWVVLNFFNTTCVPCIREHPSLLAFDERQDALGTEGAELYTVVFDDDDSAVTAFFDDEGGDWPIIRDPNGTIATSFGMSQVPETWVVSPEGLVVARFIGQVTAEGLSAQLADLREARA